VPSKGKEIKKKGERKRDLRARIAVVFLIYFFFSDVSQREEERRKKEGKGEGGKDISEGERGRRGGREWFRQWSAL